ncbi:MAG: ParB/RepB/Spo0J family partition protein [Phycisphaerales bacterium]|nr:ParB/RepB/Spo0J family partition protein [Phycisphaerae bacterium]NNF41967.1 ParB/RepB/Spo0J family partition protein [Phycisphaerales bacterium]NNM26780.1 ParB/RepB/Spo0J family partition protein [Phycisphaerales bacterium]
MPTKTKKKTTKKKTTRKKTTQKKSRKVNSRKRLTPRKEKQGLQAGEIGLDLTAREVAPLVREVESAGGAPIGAYREPLSGRPILLASLPLASVTPTPFQRDLSPTHTKRLAQKIEESGSFLDPLIVVRGSDGRLWTPNGRHRLAAAKVLGLRQITALVSPDEDLAYRILALNTEKAHNLKDQSLEVIRMARALAKQRPRTRESTYAAEFDAPELLTLGIVYAENGRFAGSAYRPLLKKLDRFTDKTLPASLRQREGYAARLEDIDAMVKEIIEELRERGFKSPYLRSYVVARLNPVRFHRAKKGDTTPPMTLAAALTRMTSAAKKFDTSSVRMGDLALVAAVASDE